MNRLTASGVWPVVHDERRALLKDLQSLTPRQWNSQSLCPEWDIHDVVAHTIDSAKTTRMGFVRRMLTTGFDFDRDNAQGVAKERKQEHGQTLAELAAVLTLSSTPPAAPATRLVEVFVHGEDIRRPLGLEREYPSAHVAHALAYQVKTAVKMGGGKERAAGWRLVASDADFDRGSGPTVRGRAISLLLAVSGRPVAAQEFMGEGASEFARHVAS